MLIEVPEVGGTASHVLITVGIGLFVNWAKTQVKNHILESEKRTLAAIEKVQKEAVHGQQQVYEKIVEKQNEIKEEIVDKQNKIKEELSDEQMDIKDGIYKAISDTKEKIRTDVKVVAEQATKTREELVERQGKLQENFNDKHQENREDLLNHIGDDKTAFGRIDLQHQEFKGTLQRIEATIKDVAQSVKK